MTRPYFGGWTPFALFGALLLPHCGDSGDGGASFGGTSASSSGGSGRGGAASGGTAAERGGTSARGGAGPSGGSDRVEGGSAGLGGAPSGGDGSTEAGGSAGGGAAGAGGGADVAGSGGTAGARAGEGGAGGEAEFGGAGGDGGKGGEMPSPRPDFILGADLSSVQEAAELGVRFVDTDGREKTMVQLLLTHGFNGVRLRSFVEPMNLYGYANPNGDPAYVRAEPYCDRDHTVEFGKAVKDAGMKLLLDLHYSDNWADPGKQIIPGAWRGSATLDELADHVETYTRDVVQSMVDGGARPDIVQIGNEITGGMLRHVPYMNPSADQWGNLSSQVVNFPNGVAVNGSATTSNWPNFAKLLKRGILAVRSVDPTIAVMLHIENTGNTGGVLSWVTNAQSQGVEFDILGLSCYTTWQGQPSAWENTFQTAARYFPNLKFVIAEYGPEARRANEILRDLPNQRGLGTFVWEPTTTDASGPGLFTRSGTTYTAVSNTWSIFDGIRSDFGLK